MARYLGSNSIGESRVTYPSFSGAGYVAITSFGGPNVNGQETPQETPQQRLQRLRSVLQRAVTDRTDPAQVQARVTEDMAALAAQVAPLRGGDPLVGELTDTLASVIQLNQQLGEEVIRLRQREDDAGVHSPI